ncbi:MAG: four-carbon acid sugar kinase family protein [Chloroflexi bacterium]|nr:four-carbon acid sugar kinase family protein [Chloroflexota bacterium]
MLLILADDLTGAADTAARCFAAGLAATVALQPPDEAPEGVLACTSDSRHRSPERAATLVRHLAIRLRRLAPGRWYKKIDSTLRGNPGAEIDALLDTLNLPWALVCPSFPAQGRGLRDGFLIVDPPLAVPPYLPSLLAEQSRSAVAALSLDDVRAGTLHLAARIAGSRRTSRILVLDALTDDDLAAICDAADLAAPDALLCGSAGLASALAQRLAAALPARRAHAMINPSDGPALLVIGSGSHAAQRQIATLRRERGIACFVPGEPVPSTGAATLLHLPAPPSGVRLDGAVARRCAALLATIALEQIAAEPPGLLVLSGGDTAMAVAHRLHLRRLEVVYELLPGIPLCMATNETGQAYAVVLKPGGFGDDHALIDVLDRAYAAMARPGDRTVH